MKKSLFITLGITAIVIILAIWAYLFIFGKPGSPDEIFANFGLGEKNQVPTLIPDTIIDVENDANDGSIQKLKQLTTRPVGGAVFVENGIRYMEQGTGHIYEIDLNSGVETLIAGTTLAQSRKAAFSKDGSIVAITTYAVTGNKTVIQRLGGNSVRASSTVSVPLPIGAREIEFGEATNTIFYVLKEQGGASGYSYNVLTGNRTQLFKVSLTDIHVTWTNPILVYTTPTVTQTGYIYKVTNNELQYVAPGKLGLMGFAHENNVIVTDNANGLNSYMVETDGTEGYFPGLAIPEKCSVAEEYIYCASPLISNTEEAQFPDNWYKGEISLRDVLWRFNITNGTDEYLSDLFLDSGREIDVSEIGTDLLGTKVYFINKNDNTLWMFDTTL